MDNRMDISKDIVEKSSLLEAYQCIIYDLRENILPASVSMQLLKQLEDKHDLPKDLINIIELRLNQTIEVIDVLMVDIFLKRLRDISKNSKETI